MAIALVAHTIKGGQSTFTTDAVDTTGATLLVMSFAGVDGVGATISDSYSNTWTSQAAQVQGIAKQQTFYVINPTVGSGYTVTVTGTSFFGQLALAAFSGTNIVSPLDQTAASSAVSTTISPGSVTPSADGEVVIAGAATLAGIFTSITGGFTISDSANSAGDRLGSAMAYLIQTTAAAANPQWTCDNNTSLAGRNSTFKAASAAGNPWYAYAQQ